MTEWGAVQAPGRRGAFANNPSGVAILSLKCKHPLTTTVVTEGIRDTKLKTFMGWLCSSFCEENGGPLLASGLCVEALVPGQGD